MKDLQTALREWHRAKFPHATEADIGLKLAEEAGEVCRALDRIHYAKSEQAAAPWLVNLTEEIGDVAIVLLVLCNRGGIEFEDVVRDRATEVMQRGQHAGAQEGPVLPV